MMNNPTQEAGGLDLADLEPDDFPNLLTLDMHGQCRQILERIQAIKQKTVIAQRIPTLLEDLSDWFHKALCTPEGLNLTTYRIDENIIPSIEATAAQLLILFNQWFSEYGEASTKAGVSGWDQVLSEVRMTGEETDLVQTSIDDKYLPFYLWEVSYNLPGSNRTYDADACEIASWFVVFSLLGAIRTIAKLASELIGSGSESQSVRFDEYILDDWEKVQHYVATAKYWDSEKWSVLCSLKEFELRIESEVRQMSLSTQASQPKKPLKAIARLKLLGWFGRTDQTITQEQAWRAWWVASRTDKELADPDQINNELDDLDQLNVSYDERHCEITLGYKNDKPLLKVLQRAGDKPTAENAEIVTLEFLGLSAESKKVFARARQEVAKYMENSRKYTKTLADERRKLLPITRKAAKATAN